MKALTLIFVVLIALLQYPLWLGKGSWLRVWDLSHQIAKQQEKNNALKARNDTLDAEVRDLKSGRAAIEERARSELGMVKQDEVFYQVLENTAPVVPAPDATPEEKTDTPIVVAVPPENSSAKNADSTAPKSKAKDQQSQKPVQKSQPEKLQVEKPKTQAPEKPKLVPVNPDKPNGTDKVESTEKSESSAKPDSGKSTDKATEKAKTNPSTPKFKNNLGPQLRPAAPINMAI